MAIVLYKNPTAHYDAGAIHYATTDSGGHYINGALLGDHKVTHKIEAGFYGDAVYQNNHLQSLHLQSSEASTKVTLTRRIESVLRKECIKGLPA